MIYGAAVNLVDYGVSELNTGANNTAALLTAMAKSKALYLPEGSFDFDSFPFTCATADDQGWTLTGASRDKTIIKATSNTTDFFSLSGIGASGSYTRYLNGCRFQNFTIDFASAPNLASSVAIRLEGTYNNLFENVLIKNITTTQTALLMKDGTYTTQFSNVDFGSSNGVIKAASNSENQVTTITFINCQFAQAILYNYLSLVFLQPIVQGSLTPKFNLTDVYGESFGLRIIGGDIEHSGGGAATYLQFDSNTKHITSIGNSFSGITTGYSNPRLTNGMTLMDNIGGGFWLSGTNTNVSINGYRRENGTTFPAIGALGIYKKGDQFTNTNPSSGGYIGWVCIVDSANTTGTISSGSFSLTVADGSLIADGQYVNVYGAGVAGGILNTYVVSGGGTSTLTLFNSASTSVTNAVVTTPGQWKAFGLIA